MQKPFNAIAFLQNFWDGQIPTNLPQFAQALGATVTERTFDDTSVVARLVSDGGQPVIEISKSETEPRKRFALAHEIGQLAAGHTTHTAHDGALARNAVTYQEIQANAFALHILMPSSAVEEAVRSLPKNQGIGHLARTFAVSETAMSARLQRLGYLRH